MKFIFFILSAVLYLVLSFRNEYSIYENLSIAFFAYILLAFLYDLGKKMVILEIIILSAIFSCLIMPIVGYHYFTSQNALARLWHRSMQVSSDDYFSFMFPATVALTLGLKIPIFYRKRLYKDQNTYLENAKKYVANKSREGLILIAVGVVASLIRRLMPPALDHLVFLLSYLMFVGVFYIIYSEMKNKRMVMIGLFAMLILRSIIDGMFGELVFMAIMTLVLMLLGKQYSFLNKLIVLCAGTLIILIIQVIKPDYRKETWSKVNSESELSIFTNILSEKLSDPSTLLSNEAVWFNFYSRFNQGLWISYVQLRVPRVYPYADGETIYLSLAGSVVPRFLWPGKPEAGGAYNFKRFLGMTLKGYSVGISPYGEAWGNFGKNGGIVFMFFFGLMFNFFLRLLLKISVNVPSLLLWFPLFFFYTVKIETEVFTMVNSFTQTAIFAYLVYRFFPKIFGGKY